MRLFVSNIAFAADEKDLRGLFVDHGYLPTRLMVCSDRLTGRPKGFAFIDVDDLVGQDAIQELDGVDLLGRRVNVQAAREKEGSKR